MYVQIFVSIVVGTRQFEAGSTRNGQVPERNSWNLIFSTLLSVRVLHILERRFRNQKREKVMEELLGSSNSGATIDSTNIGFQLLKKHGWKEGTGLGISEQGRLEPVEAYMKNNKRGLGAEKPKKRPLKPLYTSVSQKDNKEELPLKKAKALSKKKRKMQELEKQMQEKEFERTFFREFWPDNV